MTFRRDIGTAPNTFQPERRLNPQGTGDDFSDALNLTSMGLSLYGQYQREQANQARATRQVQLLDDAQKIAQDVFDAQSQKDLTAVEQQRMVSTLTEKYTNPIEKQFVMESITKTFSTGLYAEARDEIKSDSDKLDEEIRDIPEEMKALFLKDRNDATTTVDLMDNEEKRLALVKYRDYINKQENLNRAEMELNEFASVGKYREVADLQGLNTMSLLQGQLGSLIRQVDNAGTDSERAELLSSSKTNLKQALMGMKNRENTAYTSAVRRLPSKSQVDQLKVEHDSYVASVDGMMKQLDEMDEEQFDKMTRLTKFMKDQNEQELMQSFPKMMQLKEASGPGFNAVMSAVLVRQPQIQLMTADVIAEGMERMLGTAAGTAIVAQHTDLASMSNVLNGKDLMEYAAEQRDNASALAWNSVSTFVEDPEIIKELPADKINNIGKSMIYVLDRADELGDTDSMANANALLTSSALPNLVDKLPPEQQTVISKYIAQSTAEFTRRALSEDSSFLEYKDGQLQSKLTVPEAEDISLPSVLGGTSRAGAERSRVRRKVQETNLKLQRAADMLAKYNPAIDTPEQAKAYMVGSFAPDLVPKDEEAEQRKQALESGLTLAAIQQRVALDSRLENLEQATGRVANPVEQAVGTSDMDDEEFEEYIAQLRKARGK